MSLLTIVQEAAGSLNQPVPTVIFGSDLGDAVLWRNLAQRAGTDLLRRHEWQRLMTQHTWTTTATQAQADAFASDFNRLPADPEIWDRTGNQRLIGPTSSRDWQILNSTSVTGGPGRWRIIAGVLNVYPAPTAGRTFALEYLSGNWVQSATGTAQSAWAADSDIPRISSNVLTLGLIWRWLRAKGFDYAEEMSTYERELDKTASRDRGNNIMVVGGPSNDDTVTSQTWNGTIS